MNRLIFKSRQASDSVREAPEGQRVIQVILVIVLCFHVIAFTMPESHAASAPHSGPNAFGLQPDSGQTSGEAMLFRGARLAFEAGRFKEARKVWEYSARLGHAPSLYMLSNLYEYGLGTKASRRTALTLRAQAAMRGLPAAQFELGSAFFQIGSVADALHWWTQAANAGHAPAQYNLGLIHLYGLGTTKDTAQAENWLMRAASHGLARAQFYVGVMYLKGEGVAADPVTARHWIEKSAQNGYAGATVDLDSLAKYPVKPIFAR